MLAAAASVFCLAVTASAEESGVLSETQTNTASESAVPKTSPVITGNPFTPNGTGTVVDNATDSDGKEFFTIATEDGNIFYLVIDRSRGSENVYFLNAVTEADLKSLAADGNIKKASTVAALEQETAAQIKPDGEITQKSDKTENNTDNDKNEKPGSDSGTDFDMSTILVIALAVVVAGGAGFMKLRKSKGKANNNDDDEDDYDRNDFDDDDE